MKRLVLAAVLVCACTLVANGQQTHPVPKLSMAKLSADGKSLEVQQHVPEQRVRVVKRKVPVTVSEVIDGVVRQKRTFEDVEETIKVTATAIVCVPHELSAIEVRTVKGVNYQTDDLADFFEGDFRPVIVVERYKVVEEGKEVIKVNRFDPAYLKLFQPETLVVLLPPGVSTAGFAPPPAPLAPPKPE